MPRTAYRTHDTARPGTLALTTVLTAALDRLDMLDLADLPALVGIDADTRIVPGGSQAHVLAQIAMTPGNRDTTAAAALATWWRALDAAGHDVYGWAVRADGYVQAHVAIGLDHTGPLILWAHLTPTVADRWTLPARDEGVPVLDWAGQAGLTLPDLDDVAETPPVTVLRSIRGGA